MKRHTLLLGFLVLLTATDAIAQRPWIQRSRRYHGTDARLYSAAGSLFLVDTLAYRSGDLGGTFTAEPGLPANVMVMGDYFQGTTVAFTQASPTSRIHGYLTQGIAWTEFDSCTSIGRTATALTSIGLDYYIGTNSPTIYKGGQSWDSLRISDENLAVGQLQFIDGLWVALTTKGIRVSTNGGSQWTDKTVQGAEATGITYANGKMLASTTAGPMMYNMEQQRWDPMGHWESGQPESVRAMTSFQNAWYALADSNGVRRMYRLQNLDSNWIQVGYNMPGANAAVTPSMFVVDANTAIVYHVTNAADTVSGVYSYDLLDPTSVHEEQQQAFTARRVDDGISLRTSWAGTSRVTVYDITGRTLFSGTANAAQETTIATGMLPAAPCAIMVSSVADPRLAYRKMLY